MAEMLVNGEKHEMTGRQSKPAIMWLDKLEPLKAELIGRMFAEPAMSFGLAWGREVRQAHG